MGRKKKDKEEINHNNKKIKMKKGAKKEGKLVKVEANKIMFGRIDTYS